MDGWKPCELKILPGSAWNERAKVLQVAYKQRRNPIAYYKVSTPIIPKGDKLETDHEKKDAKKDITDYRLLALFSALYRVDPVAGTAHSSPRKPDTSSQQHCFSTILTIGAF